MDKSGSAGWKAGGRLKARPYILLVAAMLRGGDVAEHPGIPYNEGKQRLDLYVPAGREQFPVFVFVHGGGWVIGDRSWHKGLGRRLAEAGIGVAIPSYRLMHSGQAEDVAAAVAWVRANIAEYGGDAGRLYVGGHSAGGHLASLVALDGRYLARHGLDATAIRGVVSISGVYDVGVLPSPVRHVHAGAPPFLIAYSAFDYPGLGMQARKFAGKLRDAGVSVRVVKAPRENHISEIFNLGKGDGPLTSAVLQFVR